jgi:branched-chain amino acid transport system substrate-binding protein
MRPSSRRSTRVLAFTAVSTAIVLLTAACSSSSASTNSSTSGSAAAASGAPYVIGFTSDFSSNFGYLGIGLRAGLDSYWDAINKQGGINGHPVKMIALDDDSQVNRGVANVTQLVTQDHAIAIAGVMYSVICSAVVPILTQYKVPEICGVVTSNLMHPANPWVYATTTDQAAYAEPQLLMAEKLMAKAGKSGSQVKLAILYALGSDAVVQWANDIASGAQKLGWSTITQTVPEDAVDMTSELTKIIAAKPSVMVLAAGNDAWVTAGMSQLGAAGNPFPVVSYDVPGWSTVQQVNSQSFYYVTALAYVPPNPTEPGLKQFAEDAAADNVNPNATYVLRGYLQAEILGNALKACGWPCSGAQLEAQMNKVNFSTGGLISGNVTLSASNHEPVNSLAAYQWNAADVAPTVVQGGLTVGY